MTLEASVRPALLAHRGASHAAPENTLRAFAHALDVDAADGLELDVRLTRDLVPVVFHDVELERMTGQGGNLAERSWDELATLRAGGEPIPSLAALGLFLAERPRVVVNVELKPMARFDLLVDQCRPHLERIAAVHTVIVSSFDPRVLMRCVGPWSRALLFEDPSALRALALLPTSVDLHPSAALVDTPTLAAWAAAHGPRAVRVWTVDDPLEARRLVSLGVSTLITNRPGPLRAELGAS
ncbi:MAG: glycerophosphodiester phosphodiesterase family protein [Myxococcota bacterium]